VCEKCIEAAVQDESLDILQDLLQQGFTDVEWIYRSYKCPKCRAMDGKKFKLKDFIANLQYAAPIFEKSHVGCKCLVVVKNLNGEERIIDYTGLKQSKRAFKPIEKVKKFIDNINPFKKKPDIYKNNTTKKPDTYKDNIIKKLDVIQKNTTKNSSIPVNKNSPVK
jgi:hypothetical protein